MWQDRRARANRGRSFVATVTLCFVALSAAGASRVRAADAPAVPSGLVAFFNTNECPAGWTIAKPAQGRLIVAIADTTQKTLLGTVGTPLSDGEDRKHSHTYTSNKDLDEHHIAGSSSCCNDQATPWKDHPIAGSAVDQTSNLPFTQLTVCQKS